MVSGRASNKGYSASVAYWNALAAVPAQPAAQEQPNTGYLASVAYLNGRVAGEESSLCILRSYKLLFRECLPKQK